ncbi:MAG: tetratricopeptide repeat protein [Deltaproteobacteria bacterium]|nr:tetratricopeptide repeat protein [Deltaproteobacteria bacterium]
MINRINKFIFVFCVVALALYLVVLNTAPTTVALSPGTNGWKITGNTGVILIATFAIGIVVAGLVGLFFGVRSYFRERRLHNLEAQRRAFYDGMLRARGFAASGEWNKARVQWEQLIKKDPTDIIARTELSRSLQAAGEPIEALRILDDARAKDPKNVEVLFRAAELNIALGNKTAAIDNLALILHNHPNRRAAQLARDLSEELGRIEDAVEYQAQIESFGVPGAEEESIAARLEFKRILKDRASDKAALRTDLKALCKRRSEFVPALHRLALLEAEQGNIEEAAHYYVKAAKASHSSAYWNEISKLWMSTQNPERALAAARTATKETEGEAKLIAELELIRVQISLNQLDDARRSLDQFQNVINSGGPRMPSEILQQYLILRGLYLSQTGDQAQAAELWKKLSQNDLEINSTPYVPGGARNGSAPAPRLSTP